MKTLTAIALSLAMLTGSVNISYAQVVKASWYDCMQPGECSKRKITASGVKFNPNALTVAHRTLPFGTKLLLTHNGKSIIVTVNDRGPFVRGRTLDLSKGAARALGCLKKGVCLIDMKIIG